MVCGRRRLPLKTITSFFLSLLSGDPVTPTTAAPTEAATTVTAAATTGSTAADGVSTVDLNATAAASTPAATTVAAEEPVQDISSIAVSFSIDEDYDTIVGTSEEKKTKFLDNLKPQVLDEGKHLGDFHIADLESTTSTTFESVLSLLTCSLGLIKKAKSP